MFRGHFNSILHSGTWVPPTVASNLPSGTPVQVDLNGTGGDDHDPFGLLVGANTVTIKSPGLYLVNFSAHFNPPNSTGATVGSYRQAEFRVNAVTVSTMRFRPSNDGDFSSSCSKVFYRDFATGDDITLFLRYQGAGTISNGAGPYTRISLVQVTKGLS
jgi:hypothetical protein